ncbi:MAG: NUDIX domain-containing protein [Pirellulales bacterium]
MNANDSHQRRVPIAVAVVEREDAFLIGLRPAGAPLAGCWEFPGGKIAADETAADAACRECLEETGLEVRTIGEYPPAVHDYEHGGLALSFFACEPVRQRRTLPPRFRWVPRGELASYPFPPANDGLLQLLTANLPGSKDW